MEMAESFLAKFVLRRTPRILFDFPCFGSYDNEAVLLSIVCFQSESDQNRFEEEMAWRKINLNPARSPVIEFCIDQEKWLGIFAESVCDLQSFIDADCPPQRMGTLDDFLHIEKRVNERMALRWLQDLMNPEIAQVPTTRSNVFVINDKGEFRLQVLNLDGGVQDSQRDSPWPLQAIFFEMLHDMDRFQLDGEPLAEIWYYLKKHSFFERQTDDILSQLLLNTDRVELNFLGFIDTKICGKYSKHDFQPIPDKTNIYVGTWKKENHPEKKVAIKEITLNEVQDKVHFRRALQRIRSVNSPYIVKYVDHEVRDGHGYLVMEYVEGPTLRHFLAERHNIEPQVAYRWLRQITMALEVMRRVSIVYGTLDSNHVLLCENSDSCDVKLCGSSWSKCFLDQEARMNLSTPFTPPEIRRGEPYTEKSDIWQLGILLYEMLKGSLESEVSNILDDARRTEKNMEVVKLFEGMLREKPEERINCESLLTNLSDRFCEKVVIDSGIFGRVYLAQDKFTNSFVAVEKISMYYYDHIEREPKVMKAMQSPFVVKYLESYEKEGILYIYTEYCKGGNLREFLDNHGLLPKGITRRWMLQLIKGLVHIHSLNILHRDIKPSSIFLTKNDFSADVKFANFEISKFLDGEEHTIMVGTKNYMAPERMRFSAKYSFPSDVWSLGCVFYYMLEGKNAFNFNKLHENAIFGEQLRPRPFRNASPLEADLITKMLTVNPCTRITAEKCLQHPFIRSDLISRMFEADLNAKISIEKYLQLLFQDSESLSITGECEDVQRTSELIREIVKFATTFERDPNTIWLLLLIAFNLVKALRKMPTLPAQSQNSAKRFQQRIQCWIEELELLAESHLHALKAKRISKLLLAANKGAVGVELRRILEHVDKVLKEVIKVELEKTKKEDYEIIRVWFYGDCLDAFSALETEYWRESLLCKFVRCTKHELEGSATFELRTSFEITENSEESILRFIYIYALLFSPEIYESCMSLTILLTQLQKQVRNVCFRLSGNNGLEHRYMSPEQDPNLPPSSADNVWGLGVLVCELATNNKYEGKGKLSEATCEKFLREIRDAGKEKIWCLVNKMLDANSATRISFPGIYVLCSSTITHS